MDEQITNYLKNKHNLTSKNDLYLTDELRNEILKEFNISNNTLGEVLKNAKFVKYITKRPTNNNDTKKRIYIIKLSDEAISSNTYNLGIIYHQHFITIFTTYLMILTFSLIVILSSVTY